MKSAEFGKSTIKLLNILARQGNRGTRWEKKDNDIILLTPKGHRIFKNLIINGAKTSGLIMLEDEILVITRAGRSKLRRHLCDHDPFAGQHQQLQRVDIAINSQFQTATENCAESPLARLYKRKQKDGTRFISMQQYQAGGRLRRDFEKARLQPSVSARWEERVSTGNKSHYGNDAGNLSDIAIDARSRLEKAINAMGPELSGVTLDICCFLKGFETVERERNWPCRSAKLMLKTALSKLARHYGLTTPTNFRTNEDNDDIGHWGTSDYRPTL